MEMEKGQVLVSGVVDGKPIRFSTPTWGGALGASNLDPLKTFDPVQDLGDLRPDIDKLLEKEAARLNQN